MDALRDEMQRTAADIQRLLAELDKLATDHPDRSWLQQRILALQQKKAALQQERSTLAQKELLMLQQQQRDGLVDAFAKELKLLFVGMKDQLCELVKKGSLAAMKQQQDDSVDGISISLSNAGSTVLQEVLQRANIPLEKGLQFSVPVPMLGPLDAHCWPRNSRGKEQEVAGYPAAMTLLNRWVCPPRVVAILKHEQSWLQSKPLPKVHVKDGKTDVVFVLEEFAPAIARDDADLLDNLLGIVGQAELKTCTAMQAIEKKTSRCFGQAGFEHIAASHLHTRLLESQARITRVELPDTVKQLFATLLTDLNASWLQLQYSASTLQVTKPAALPLEEARVAAAEGFKRTLAESSEQLRALLISMRVLPHDGHGHPPSQTANPVDTAPSSSSSAQSSPSGGSAQQQAPVSTQQQTGSSHLQPSDGASAMLSPEDVTFLSARAKEAAKAMREDDDLRRIMMADFSKEVTHFLRQPIGYRDFLSMSKPPSTVYVPDVDDLLHLTPHQLAEHVRAEMRLLHDTSV
ncbi:hypothetical protein HaLaN_00452 [Haematococcus lacustris]|uniref:Uncharacterized protein n=1 Tax=Haematococcus lacustris TaxID=44745 RepID=A0A699Y6Q3_HAELA|nr:hypothetical protein HaLaN_00452 [Haematococcus lacustris]